MKEGELFYITRPIFISLNIIKIMDKDHKICENCKLEFHINEMNESEDGEVFICLDCFDDLMNYKTKLDN